MKFFMCALLCSVFLIPVTSRAVRAESPTLEELETKGTAALRERDQDAVREISDQIASAFPDQYRAAVIRGDLLLRAGLPALSLKAWDEAVRLRPEAEPYLWQRGIAQYYAGRFADGAELFEKHRTVNANDVENAVWHFLCVARDRGLKAARDAYLPAPGDPRVPMQEVYDLFAGIASADAVMERIRSIDLEAPSGKNARFYGYLYLSLYADVTGDLPQAREYIDKAVELGLTHYMADIAWVHQQRLNQRKEDK